MPPTVMMIQHQLWMNESVQSIGGMILMGKPKYPEKKIVLVPLIPPQITHGLAWNRAKASVVKGQQLTA
jgi:hypothetical protein